jgi:hypothetical protein
MPKRFFNWKFKDVESFLKENGFKLNYTNASHFYYMGITGGILKMYVCLFMEIKLLSRGR